LNAAGGDLRLKPDAPLFATVGFKPIPLEEIGLYLDDWRASWPARPGNGRSPPWMALDSSHWAARPAAIKPAETRPAAAAKAKEPNAMIPSLRQAILRLTPLHEPLEKPQPGDWLAQHKEPGQTFDEYLGCSPITPRGRRSVLYVQALGPLTPTQRKIVDLTREYLACYFGVTCREGNDLLDALVPASARRTHPAWGDKQILSTYVLDKVLKPRLPSDAAASIALTASDLWPGEGWNFVFGQASLQDRVGVWSLCRFGDPNESDKAFRLCLRRTLQTASHETGHMFSILHCTA
jgi:hypothetical protein